MISGDATYKYGLYDSKYEHSACGVGFVAQIKGIKSHRIVCNGLEILNNLSHRGAVGADSRAGDGVGILLQISDHFFRKKIEFDLPQPGKYAIGVVFMPQSRSSQAEIKGVIERYIIAEGQQILGWRDVPANNRCLGKSVLPIEPVICQIFVGCGNTCQDQQVFERKLFIIRKQIENRIIKSDILSRSDFYIATLSSRVIVYKGMLLADQIGEYYPDLLDPDMDSALALVHQRFSTNTFPTWDLAQPFRMIAHNGEINTIRGNVNWIAARRQSMSSMVIGEDLSKIWPLIAAGQSDSACFDNVLELLVASGYSLSHAMMMMIPEAWSGNALMDVRRRAFYEYHAALMEPWDGPAAVAFTDGRQIGATLDRNGLRPARYLITNDDVVVMASEAGVLTLAENKIIKKWRLQPGKMFLIDMEQGRIIENNELKQELASSNDYQSWLDQTQFSLANLRPAVGAMSPDGKTLLKAQQAFGYSQEDLNLLLLPMVEMGVEAVGSMGADNPLSVLSAKCKHLSTYFKQRFAQVTNPPIDPIREELVMSLLSLIGPRPNLLSLEDGGHDMRLVIDQPILTNNEFERIRQIEDHTNGAFRTRTLSICFSVNQGIAGMGAAITDLCRCAEKSVQRRGYNILILSDRKMDVDHIAIPALLATSAVHHHLIQKGLRTESGLVVETGAALEVHHFATLAGYGAEAINPYVAFDTVNALLPKLSKLQDFKKVQQKYIMAINKGLKKVMAKMGISTFQSYCGAQIFDAVGLSSELVDRYFAGTVSTVEGADLESIAIDSFKWHKNAFGENTLYHKQLDVGGEYAWRLRGEQHVWTPTTVSKLQHSCRTNNATIYTEFAQEINNQDHKLLNLRGLFKFNQVKRPISIEEVEVVDEIVKRFSTGAMSFGSISPEAHSTLARAMNQLGGKSNTGEGGEEVGRFRPLTDGSPNPLRSAIKQVASGRFGVSTEYLVNADEIQIKMAQGAKPGEGGQLSGHKINQQIAKVRHSIPGVGLISPPPHHDIYSIEDLAQLIHDLKNVNPKARISVKLVSEVGVGTIAAGVSKAHADHITISGYDGGTGASPLTSIKHAGLPWEIGLAETHQTLVMNQLRGRVAIQVDGGLRTGRDVVIGALLGADEFGFATAPLIAQGCIMMRKCHLNTCPVGIATQDPQLRAKFKGQPEHVINYFVFIAEEVRQLMAQLGFRTMDQMVGQMDHLDMCQVISNHKASGLDFSRLLSKPQVDKSVAIYHREEQEHELDKALDHELIKQAKPALEYGESVHINITVRNYNRTFGAMLSGRVAEIYGHQGLPEDTIHIVAEGIVGQSFGAWAAHGISIELIGEANDYVGKGLSGGRLVIYPPKNSAIGRAEENIIVGNTVLYGAISGECYFRGVAGERFCVRNSGATAVVEGVGDHCCEYMTGGVVVCLGQAGKNFAAGMSGGIAYVYDAKGDFRVYCNSEMVSFQQVKKDTRYGDLANDNHLINDEYRLKSLIEKHFRYTDSDLARVLLDDWEFALTQFVKVIPNEYSRILSKIQIAADDNLNPALAQQEVK